MNTKQTLGLLTAMLALTALPGCWTTSLHALYENDDPHLTYDPALIGTWQPDSDSPLVITGDSKLGDYTLESSDDDGRYVYEGRLVQLGSYRFLDVVPIVSYNASSIQQEVEPGYFPMHSILKVILEENSLVLIAPDDAQLCKDAHENKLTAGDCVDGDFVFTTRTGILQDFFLKHADDLEIFPQRQPDAVLHRVVKQGAPK